ncbi:YigZ family protein [Tenacibaculum finnmarkense]|nr:YigZ family protein [Tenacibaculum finnmarkense]
MSDINNTDQNKIKDTYKTIDVLSEETLFKDRNSKFFGYAFPVSSEEQVKEAIEGLRKKHHTARHFCYAWQFGIEAEKMRFRANDDGEPSNSAGMPIYGQIQAFDVTNDIDYQLNFGYDMMNKVQRVVKERNLNITAQKLEMDCEYIISVRKKDAQIVFDIFDNLFKVNIKRMDED